MSQLRKVLLHFDSSDRNKNIDAESHKYVIHLKEPRLNIKFFEIVNIQLPFTWYVIRTGYNDELDFEDSGGLPETAILPEGTYGINDLVKTIKIEMEKLVIPTFTVTYNTRKKTITIKDDLGNFCLFTANGNPIWELLGYDTSANHIGSQEYEGENVYNMSGGQFVYLQSDIQDNLKDNNIVNKNDNSILAKIPINVAFGQTILYEPSQRIKFSFQQLMMTEIPFRLFDKNFDELDLHKIDWSISILFYEKINVGQGNIKNIGGTSSKYHPNNNLS